MAFFQTLKNKAAESLFNKISSYKPSKLELFRDEFKLPLDESIVEESNVEISFDYQDNDDSISIYFAGKLFLTQHFLVFKDTYDEKVCSFVLHLNTIKKFKEKQLNQSFLFGLTIQTYSNLTLTIQFIGIRSNSERFAFNFKKLLKKNLSNLKLLKPFLLTLYSEYLLAKNLIGTDPETAASLVPPQGGLGLIFKYPGNPKVLRDKSKMRLWFNYLKSNGKNLTLTKQNLFYRLIRIGLPNRIRGEIWELCCGSMYLRYQNQTLYQDILNENSGKNSQAIEEIEKDLNRSLPEYPAYQNEEGIHRLRNVLTAYSWKNPEVGYCQAMNIVVAALLIYMSEEQAFWCLSVLCDKYCPGYYSKTMYGTLLDQKVFEALVEKTMPILWEHIIRNDIQLSIVSLPWFLSLFLSSMPLVFAFRIIDVFFLQGPKTLFQVALAILKINGEELLSTTDDGTFISILKNYFSILDQSAHPNAKNENYRNITKFQELLVVAFKEFFVITDDMIMEYRYKHKDKVFQDIESFVKRTQIRNLPRTPNLSSEDISNIYDRYYQIIQQNLDNLNNGIYNSNPIKDTNFGSSSLMDFKKFQLFMSQTCYWVNITDSELINNLQFIKNQESFLSRLFLKFAKDRNGSLSLNELIRVINRLVCRDLMKSLENFFKLYDTQNTGFIDKDGILQMSEGLLYLTTKLSEGLLFDKITEKKIQNAYDKKFNSFQEEIEKKINEIFSNTQAKVLPEEIIIDKKIYQHEQMERYLLAASNFIQRAFEYAQPVEPIEKNLLQIDDLNNDFALTLKANKALNDKPLIMDLATFRMVILADETYELFFTNTLPDSIQVKGFHSSNDNRDNRKLRDMLDSLFADGRRMANEVRKRIDNNVGNGGSPSDNASITSGRSSRRATINSSINYEEEDDDFAINNNDVHDQDLLLGAEIKVLNDIPTSSLTSNE
ncbi:GTPase-activating protein MDR1, partial [Ascoidea rubescens DSM 1968]